MEKLESLFCFYSVVICDIYYNLFHLTSSLRVGHSYLTASEKSIIMGRKTFFEIIVFFLYC